MRLLLLALLAATTLPVPAQPFYDVRDYGAPADTAQTATAALQAAIDAAHAAGGGTVLVPPGAYRSGSLQLRSFVTLHLAAGATLYASRDAADYAAFGTNDGLPALLYAEDAEFVGLEGRGRIVGQPRRVEDELRQVDGFIAEETANAHQAGIPMRRYYKLPPVFKGVVFKRCRDVRVEGVSILDMPQWLLHVQWSERVVIRGVRIESDLLRGVNADGIDINGSRDVLIADSIVKTGDDAIVLKSTEEDGVFYPTENVVVTGCVVTSTSSGLKIGTETFGDFRHIIFANTVVRGSNRGLAVIVRDGGTVEDVLFSNITVETERKDFYWWGDGDPIWLVIRKRTPDSPLGRIRDVVFENIQATGPGTSRIEGFAPTPQHPDGRRIERVQLRNVRLAMTPEGTPDARADHALDAHHTSRLVLDGVEVRWSPEAEAGWRSALSVRHSDGLRVHGFRGRQGRPDADAATLRLHDVADALVHDIEATPGAGTLVRVTGAATAAVRLSLLDPTGAARRVLDVGPAVPADAVRVDE